MRFKEDLPETGSSSNSFLKLKDKESVVGIFRGEPRDFYAAWDGKKYVEVAEDDPNGSFRFKINFVIKEGANYVPKIFENGVAVYRQLAELNAEYDLSETTVKITRNGTGTDTAYSILPLLKTPPSKEALAYLAKMELLPLEAQNGHREFKANSTGEESIPF